MHQNRSAVFPLLSCLVLLPGAILPAAEPVFRLDLAKHPSDLRLVNGARLITGPFGPALEFTHPLQYAEVPFSRRLNGLQSMTVGGWFFPRRTGEQAFFFRGLPEIAPQGERIFRPNDKWVNFILGTDGHGFLLGAINGNGSMPFPLVTLNEVPFDAWNQIAVVKHADGHQSFYLNGSCIHCDHDAAAGGKPWPFRDLEDGEPLRLAMPLGGLIGEAWIHARELTDAEIRADFEQNKRRFHPAHPARPVALRDMDLHPAPNLWPGPITAANWPRQRDRILAGVRQVLGPMPGKIVPLEPRLHSEVDCGAYLRRKVSFQVQEDDRMTAYLLVPKRRSPKTPAIICFYGTTSGAGKETTVGLSGPTPNTPPAKNRAFAVDMVEAGFIALAPDYLRDGERIQPGRRPYDTADFYARFPDWSVHGKDAWDTMRAIDYLQSLDSVDPDRIGMIGHSYGGHSTIFTTALEPRIKAAWANGPVSDFRHHGLHWAVPKGAGNSQSLPAMRPYVLDHTLPIPVTFYEFTALIAPRPLVVGQAVGERRPMEEENAAAVTEVYRALSASDRICYVWYPGDHDFPPNARRAAVEWFQRWLGH